MTESTSEPGAAGLQELSRECESLGYLNGMDYFIWGVPAEMSSELVELGVEGGVYTVWYRDMGRRRVVGTARDLARARAVFLDELARLAGPRGRGPSAGAPPTGRYDGLSPEAVFEQMRRDGLFS